MTLTVAPEVVAEGALATVRIILTDAGAQPLSGVTVTLEAGGGLFAGTGKPFVSGRTGSAGIFEAEWSCSDCAAAYQILARARTSGGAAEARDTIGVHRHRAGAPLAVTAGVAPAVLAPGATATVTVAVFRGAKPASGAEVKIGVGGGRFLADTARLSNLAVGRTDSSGYYRVEWTCRPCATAYEFTTLIVAVPGDEPLQIKTPLTIGATPPPPARLSAVRGRLQGCNRCIDFQVTASREGEAALRRSVRVDGDCSFNLSLPPGLYAVEFERIDRSGTVLGHYEVQVNPFRETNLLFRCE